MGDLLRREQSALAEFLVALANFDRQRSWVELGHSSLFYYLHRELKLSAGAAYLRKAAAELIQRFPEVIEPLRDGRLCLSSVGELAKVISTCAFHNDLAARAVYGDAWMDRFTGGGSRPPGRTSESRPSRDGTGP